MTDSSFFPDIETLHAKGTFLEDLHCRARTAADRVFGKTVFVRGVIEISNFCRENCAYCGMRRDNKQLHRYRARLEDLADLIFHHRPACITDINLQAGEDPVAVREIAIPLIRAIRRETPLGVSVCLGTLDTSLYGELKDAGATIYILKFEIAEAPLYRQMQAPGTLSERLESIRHLASKGWNVSSGFIAGLPGQSNDRLVENFRTARELPLSGCSVSPFIPGDETPLGDSPAADIDLTLNCMAALRLMRPDWVIPAVSALNLSEPGSGYRRGLRAGANLVTINMTPEQWRNDYLLYKRDRFIMTEERILSAISDEKLSPSSRSLADWYRSVKIGAAPSSAEQAKPVAA